eukprot:787-Amphidinium_carterae.1
MTGTATYAGQLKGRIELRDGDTGDTVSTEVTAAAAGHSSCRPSYASLLSTSFAICSTLNSACSIFMSWAQVTNDSKASCSA